MQAAAGASMASDIPKSAAGSEPAEPAPELPAPSPPGMLAAYLDMPPERRAAAEAHAALLSLAAAAVAGELPLSADVADFPRVLIAEARS
jgi:hypothetical protein